MKKFITLVVMAVIGMAVMAVPESVNPVVVLDTYDQLQNYVGDPRTFYVRDAGSSVTGQHGDPRIRGGYAVYVWDDRSVSWKIIGSQDEVDLVSTFDSSKIVTKSMYEEDINVLKQKINMYEGVYIVLTNEIAQLNKTVVDITDAFDVESFLAAKAKVEKHREAFAKIATVEISDSSTFRELKAAVNKIKATAAEAIAEE